ncbi:MAG: hypothetical protein HN846_04955 [Candidatus Pacebacteria bacterium]|jgi:hypothetical protein|nr:hypothetical protein [Candidatus Paceibacterota bacterium]MBT4004766.1 hypothetical protein [Candidatus Paceibacterota bacterium]MBT7184143.1 hypothetical protein [Candidatus Paceibacterota bacterium]MBT7310025.1 hypothetical protein [Candidatus Paceibacterota bacterium]
MSETTQLNSKTPLFFNKKKTLVNFVLVLVSILISLLVVEIYLIKINYPYQNCETVNQTSEFFLGEFNHKTGWSYQKSISFFDKDGKYEYYFDENGIRSSDENYQIDYQKPRILFVGGSVTFGEGLHYEDTFPAQINSLLEDRFEVINLGVQGFGSAQSMAYLKIMIEKIRPSYVIYTFIQDHINRDINYDRRLHVKCFEFSGTKPVFTLKNNKLEQVKKPQEYKSVDRFKILLFLSMSYQNFLEKILMKNEVAIDITKAIINEVSNLSNENNARDYYIYYDTLYEASPNSWNDYLSSRVFGGVEKGKVLNFTNWADDSKKTGLKYYISSDDDYHPNASLSAEIAKKFVDKFGDEFND